MEKNIKKRGRPRKNDYTPSILTCKITGEKVKTNPVQFKKQLAASGLTFDEYVNGYISRKGKRILREKEASKVEIQVVKRVTKETTPIVDNFDNNDLDEEDEARRLKESRTIILNEKLELLTCIRPYPVTCYDTVMDTYNEYLMDTKNPRESWKLATHLHRSSKRLYDRVSEIDKLIPYSKE